MKSFTGKQSDVYPKRHAKQLLAILVFIGTVCGIFPSRTVSASKNGSGSVAASSGQASMRGANGVMPKSSAQLNLRFTNNPYLPDFLTAGAKPKVCPEVMIIGLRGSGERPTIGQIKYFVKEAPVAIMNEGQSYYNWNDKTGFTLLPKYGSEDEYFNSQDPSFYNFIFGETVGPHIAELRKNLQSKYSKVGIWSVGVDDLHFDKIKPKNDLDRLRGPQSVYHAGSIALKYNKYPVGQNFINLLGSDISRNQTGYVEPYAALICPETTQYYFIGYSQGAIIARILAQNLVKTHPAKFKGLMLIADPLFNAENDTCCYAHTMSSNHIKNLRSYRGAKGIGWFNPLALAKGTNLRDSLASALVAVNLKIELKELEKSGGVLTICTQIDAVCDFSIPNLLWRGVVVHTSSYKWPKNPCIGNRIAYLLKLATTTGEVREKHKKREIFPISSCKTGN